MGIQFHISRYLKRRTKQRLNYIVTSGCYYVNAKLNLSYDSFNTKCILYDYHIDVLSRSSRNILTRAKFQEQKFN